MPVVRLERRSGRLTVGGGNLGGLYRPLRRAGPRPLTSRHQRIPRTLRGAVRARPRRQQVGVVGAGQGVQWVSGPPPVRRRWRGTRIPLLTGVTPGVAAAVRSADRFRVTVLELPGRTRPALAAVHRTLERTASWSAADAAGALASLDSPPIPAQRSCGRCPPTGPDAGPPRRPAGDRPCWPRRSELAPTGSAIAGPALDPEVSGDGQIWPDCALKGRQMRGRPPVPCGCRPRGPTSSRDPGKR
jgi:hypothetical protein